MDDDTHLLQIEPPQLTFIFQFNKHTSCLLHLNNNSTHYVAFKVKTTSPTKYCVRPTIGIIKPHQTSDFTVTMQAQRTAPLDFHCKDKFLVQSTIVPFGTTQDDISSDLFAKDSGNHVEEKKLRVVLLPPKPNGGDLNQKDAPLPPPLTFFEEKSLKTAPQDMEEDNRTDKDVDSRCVENVGDMKPPIDAVELSLAEDSEELKLRLSVMDSKLREAEGTIMKLNEERRRNTREKDLLKQELVLKRKINVKSAQAGFPFMFVCVVALVGVAVGYYIHP